MAPIEIMHANWMQKNPKRRLVTALVGGSTIWVNVWPDARRQYGNSQMVPVAALRKVRSPFRNRGPAGNNTTPAVDANAAHEYQERPRRVSK